MRSLATSLAGDYTAVYFTVPTATDASPEVRDLIDMTDAAAQAALKRAIEIDAIADMQMDAAERIIQEVQAAAPGMILLLSPRREPRRGL